MPQFADVILPLALNQSFTYTIPASMEDKVGRGVRVLVQFGQRRIYAGIVVQLHNKPPDYTVKEVLQVEDDRPIVNDTQLLFWSWMADYYMCSGGEVMNAALPSALKMQSETRVTINRELEVEEGDLGDVEFRVYDLLLEQKSLSISEIGRKLNWKNPMPLLRRMFADGYIDLDESIVEKVRPKKVRRVRWSPDLSKSMMSEAFESLTRAPVQKQVLLAYFKLAAGGGGWVHETEVLSAAGAKRTALKALLDKGWMEEGRFDYVHEPEQMESEEIAVPNEEQQTALDTIRQAWGDKPVCLLYGVTSSGKTECYIHLIREQMEAGRQTLFTVPEIALTAQMIQRLQRHFGSDVATYHSRMSDRERLELWERMIDPKRRPAVILGARSAVFLPFSDLGLVIVDEEHETSYKQHDPAPRYHGRDAAIVLAQLHKGRVLLGSATPSLESYYNTMQGKYGFAELRQRFGGVRLPVVEAVDIRKEHMRRQMMSHFSPRLIEEIQTALAGHMKVILFQNRRGFAPVVLCINCGHAEQCVNCDITLTYHKGRDLLRCHYCGYSIDPPKRCTSCGSPELKMQGFGTEKVEEELQSILPEARIARMDLDATRKKNSFQTLVNRFERGEIDVLIGTQMVAKGLDFDDVALVGILAADGMLSYPDFRAHERAFQLMSQVAGRSGRRNERGLVLIQSFRPDHRIIQQVTTYSYEEMYREQNADRKQYQYPPYCRLIHVELRHARAEVLNPGAEWLAVQLKSVFGKRILGPEFPPIARVRGMYQKRIIMKLEPGMSLKKVKNALRSEANRLNFHRDYKRIRVFFDVDPY